MSINRQNTQTDLDLFFYPEHIIASLCTICYQFKEPTRDPIRAERHLTVFKRLGNEERLFLWEQRVIQQVQCAQIATGFWCVRLFCKIWQF